MRRRKKSLERGFRRQETGRAGEARGVRRETGDEKAKLVIPRSAKRRGIWAWFLMNPDLAPRRTQRAQRVNLKQGDRERMSIRLEMFVEKAL
jgi:hypothetical protein